MTTSKCTGNGTVVEISDKRHSCHVKCGNEIYKGITPAQIKILNEG